MTDDDFNFFAVHNFKIRTYGGFGLGILTALGGIVLLVISIVRKEGYLIGDSILIILLGLLLAFICGCFIFRKKKKEDL